MSRYELVEKFNYYTRKRDCYNAKIQNNDAIKTIIETGMISCNTYMEELSAYVNDANIFKELYDKNEAYFNATEKNRLLGIVNVVEEHLASEKQNAQNQINYWYSKIQAYDEEQRRLQEAATTQGN